MKDISILFPESINFHDRNFKSLFDFISRHKLRHTFLKDRNNWISAYGNYGSLEDELTIYVYQLQLLSKDELINKKTNNINLFNTCRDEALTFYLPLKEFREKLFGVPSNESLFELMWQVDQRTLLLNMAASWSWISYWKEQLKKQKIHTYACIFSGAQIYNRALIETLKTHPTTPLVMEHFFTGNEYYIEEKYQPIPNNTNLKNNNYYKSVKINESSVEWNRLKIKATNKILLSRNKNVTQPIELEKINSNNKEIVTIIGQVLNDYSIICTATNYLSSIDFYIELIDKLLEETDKFIVFKAHPWEHQKNNLKGALTSTEIRNHINSLSQDKAERVLITENFNLHNLFKQSKTVITLCSQSAIEAAFFGIKPVQLGQAFYGKKGFSYDYNLIEDFINDYKSESFPSYLTIDEFDKLEEFLVKHLEKSLVSIHKSGILALENKLRQPSLIPLVKPVLKKTVTETHHIPSLLTEKALPIEKIKSVINNEESVISDIIATVEASKVVIKRKGNIIKKIRKLQKKPRDFFNDSNNPVLKMVGNIAFKKS